MHGALCRLLRVSSWLNSSWIQSSFFYSFWVIVPSSLLWGIEVFPGLRAHFSIPGFTRASDQMSRLPSNWQRCRQVSKQSNFTFQPQVANKALIDWMNEVVILLAFSVALLGTENLNHWSFIHRYEHRNVHTVKVPTENYSGFMKCELWPVSSLPPCIR